MPNLLVATSLSRIEHNSSLLIKPNLHYVQRLGYILLKENHPICFAAIRLINCYFFDVRIYHFSTATHPTFEYADEIL